MEKHIIIGAGPAGLTAAWQLVELGRPLVVLESDPDYVGGIARTVSYKGNRFDMGGHRFYTKSDHIDLLWHTMLPDDWIQVPRLSRIFYDRHFFPYPLSIKATLQGLGIWRSLKILASYAMAQVFPRRPEASFEDWIVNRFGYQLYETFFKTYTEKVWGIPCNQINKDFAAQRIRGLSLFTAVKNALLPPKGDDEVKTLIKKFFYPRLGPGQLWEAVRDHVIETGNEIELGKTVVKINHCDGIATSVTTQDGEVYEGSHFYSTMTLKDFVNALDPPPPQHVLEAGHRLKYRDFITVAVIVDRASLFPDNWIYVHDSAVQVGRIQNYKNWSRDMVADSGTTCLGMEYFCNCGEDLWEMDDDELVRLAARELQVIGLCKETECLDGCVVRLPNTYPLYDEEYKQHRETLKNWLNSYFSNVYPAGRGGLHNYNSQDHSMMAAIYSVRNMNEQARLDVWSINTEMEYAEEGKVEHDFEARLVAQPLASHSGASTDQARSE